MKPSWLVNIMPNFTNHAHYKMMDLFNNHSHEVGSQIASSHPGKTPTDCITYVINVLKYAFEKSGDKASAEKVSKLGEYGTELAAYLVKEHNWKGIYYNPDINHPRDGNVEHVYSYYKKLLHSKQYYTIPITYLVINYKPTPKTNGNYKSFSRIGGSKDPTTKTVSQLERLKKVKFAVGVSRGGKHLWLFSFGKLYEVHWDKIGSDLYGATDLEDYSWLSGALVVPPDAISAANFDGIGNIWDTFVDFLKNLGL